MEMLTNNSPCKPRRCTKTKQAIVILIFFSVILFTSFISAIDIEFIGKQNTKINIIETCSIDDSYCTSDYKCNMTVISPTKIISNNTLMTNQISFHNASLNFTQTEEVGTYRKLIICSNGIFNGTTESFFEITPSGKQSSISQGLIYITLLFLSVCVFAFAFYGAIKLNWKHPKGDDGVLLGVNDLRYVKLILWFVSYLLLMWVFFLSWNISESFLYLKAIGTFFWMLYSTTMIFLLPIFVVFLYMMVASILESAKLKKLLDRGLMPR